MILASAAWPMFLLATVAAGCANSGGHKMPWRTPTRAVAWPAQGGAQGGALTTDDRPAPPASKVDRPKAPPSAQPFSVVSTWRELWHPLPPTPRAVGFRWPLPATGINSLYGWRTDPIDGQRRFHHGVDLDAEYARPVEATADGYVVEASWRGGHGRRVVVRHAGGFQSTYSHLAQTLVYPGMNVRAGQAIGLVGDSGRSTGTHLHFEISRWGASVDPLEILGTTIDLAD